MAQDLTRDLDRVALPDRIRQAVADTSGARDAVSLHLAGPCPEVLAEPGQLDARLRELLRRALEHLAPGSRVPIEVTPRSREVEVAIGEDLFTLPVALLSDSGRR